MSFAVCDIVLIFNHCCQSILSQLILALSMFHALALALGVVALALRVVALALALGVVALLTSLLKV